MVQGQETRTEYVERIVGIAAAACHTTPDAVFGKSHVLSANEARQAVIWRLREQNWSLMDIGRFMRRDHSTVSHNLRTIQRRIKARDIDVLDTLARIPSYDGRGDAPSTAFLVERVRKIRDDAAEVVRLCDERLKVYDSHMAHPPITRAG